MQEERIFNSFNDIAVASTMTSFRLSFVKCKHDFFVNHTDLFIAAVTFVTRRIMVFFFSCPLFFSILR